MTTINNKLWLSTTELVATYGYSAAYWRKRAKEGKVVSHNDGAKLLFSKASIEAYLTGEKVDDSETSYQKEIRELREEKELFTLRRDNALLKQGFNSVEELIKARDEFEPKRQALVEQEARLSKKQTKQDETANEQYQEKERIRKAWAELVECRKLFESDLTTMREAYQSSCNVCRLKLPEPQDMKLSPSVFEKTGAVSVKWEVEIPSEEQSEQFDEKEGE